MVEDDKNTIKRIGTFMAKPSGTTPKPLGKTNPPCDSALGILAKASESVDLNESHSSRIFQTYPG